MVFTYIDEVCLYCAGMDSVHTHARARAWLLTTRFYVVHKGTQLFCLVQGSFFGIRLVVWCCGSFHGTIAAHEAHSTLFQELMGLSVGGVVLRCCCGVPFSLKMMDLKIPYFARRVVDGRLGCVVCAVVRASQNLSGKSSG